MQDAYLDASGYWTHERRKELLDVRGDFEFTESTAWIVCIEPGCPLIAACATSSGEFRRREHSLRVHAGRMPVQEKQDERELCARHVFE